MIPIISDMPPQEIDISDQSRSPSPSTSSLSSDASSDAASSQSSNTSCSSPPPRWSESDSVHVIVRPGGIQKSSTFPGSVAANEQAQWQRCHSRRTSMNCPPPGLVRSTDVKGQFVNNLVASAKCLVEVIWPLAACDRHNLTLQTYIQEILKRTKTSFSTLQVALYYLLLIKAHVPSCDFSMEQPPDMSSIRGFQCGRRMFLAAIILASKYLQDRNYTSKAWSKITSLPVEEINANEIAFLRAVNWQLHITEGKFNRWQNILVDYSKPAFVDYWKQAVKVLRPELDNLPPMTRPTIRTDFATFSSGSWPMTPMTPLTPSSEFSPSRVNTPHERPMAMQPPFAPRIERLATPRMAENYSQTCPIPAANSARPLSAMCSAMSLMQKAASMRSTTDYGTAPCRQYSMVPAILPPIRSISSSSSPDSMVSDNSSLASRSSSVSSVSLHSATFAPRTATWLRPTCSTTLTASPENLVIEEGTSSPTHHYSSPQPSITKKRPARWSVDLAPIDVRRCDESPAAASARSMLMRASTARKVDTIASLATLVHSGHGMTVRDGGRYAGEIPSSKRLCVGSARPVVHRASQSQVAAGPGMWSGIL